MQLRDAEADDLPAILAIYNEVILNSTAVYFEAPIDLADRQAWFEARRRAGHPVLVAAEGDEVLGFGSFGDWGRRPATRALSSTRCISAPTGEGRGSAGRWSAPSSSALRRPAST
jgi:L-amino acid N-acyltransferase YncA